VQVERCISVAFDRGNWSCGIERCPNLILDLVADCAMSIVQPTVVFRTRFDEIHSNLSNDVKSYASNLLKT
jgi:hypothetical protein